MIINLKDAFDNAWRKAAQQGFDRQSVHSEA